ncbi:unnamed protein product [Ceratitis capitata]|uniref:(Mediterranean fruit fly) hypothetical protein n=1 Tax=Ceratitis capitata TaxID=7213 RepID=A0A811VK30_CERCA|nr:unnamed protein product [Ceratitis capitata]
MRMRKPPSYKIITRPLRAHGKTIKNGNDLCLLCEKSPRNKVFTNLMKTKAQKRKKCQKMYVCTYVFAISISAFNLPLLWYLPTCTGNGIGNELQPSRLALKNDFIRN